jgi:Protein of unknown function (DUF1569)
MSKEMVDTKKVSRRSCSYKTLEEFKEDLQRVESANQAGTLSCSGNWTAGMNLEHIAKAFEFSLDGFPIRVAAPVRWIATLMFKKKILSGETFPAGIKPPPKFLVQGDLSAPLPDKNTSFEDGMSRLREVINRLETGSRFTAPSPVFGKLTHEESMRVQLGHAALHMGFMRLS